MTNLSISLSATTSLSAPSGIVAGGDPATLANSETPGIGDFGSILSQQTDSAAFSPLSGGKTAVATALSATSPGGTALSGLQGMFAAVTPLSAPATRLPAATGTSTATGVDTTDTPAANLLTGNAALQLPGNILPPLLPTGKFTAASTALSSDASATSADKTSADKKPDDSENTPTADTGSAATDPGASAIQLALAGASAGTNLAAAQQPTSSLPGAKAPADPLRGNSASGTKPGTDTRLASAQTGIAQTPVQAGARQQSDASAQGSGPATPGRGDDGTAQTTAPQAATPRATASQNTTPQNSALSDPSINAAVSGALGQLQASAAVTAANGPATLVIPSDGAKGSAKAGLTITDGGTAKVSVQNGTDLAQGVHVRPVVTGAATQTAAPVTAAADADKDTRQDNRRASSDTGADSALTGVAKPDVAAPATPIMHHLAQAATGPTTLAASAATTTSSVTPASGNDMAALVDRLVEARAVARSTATSQVVQAAVTHAEFGQVSLRFEQDDDGMTVSMSSADPAFAGAAQAALAASPHVAATAGSNDAGMNNASSQQGGQSGQGSAGNGQGQFSTSQQGSANAGSANAGNTGGQSGNGQQQPRDSISGEWRAARNNFASSGSWDDTSDPTAQRGIFA